MPSNVGDGTSLEIAGCLADEDERARKVMRERNKNHKRTSQAQIKATNEVVKTHQDSVGHLLFTRPVLARLGTKNT